MKNTIHVGDEVIVTIKTQDSRLKIGTTFMACVSGITEGCYIVEDGNNDFFTVEPHEIELDNGD